MPTKAKRSPWPLCFVGFQLVLFALLILDRNLDDEHIIMTLTSHAGLLVLFVFVFSAFAGGLFALHQKRLLFLAVQVVLVASFVLGFVFTANQIPF